ncbi:MAG: hypothetical protein ABIY52_04915 [Gemmatimonadaceae bacterium]
MKKRFALLACVAALALAGTPSGAQELKREKDKITRAEIEASPQRDQDIYQVIRSLRPQFLRAARGVRSFNGVAAAPVLYVDGRHESDLDALKALPAAAVQEVRYLDPSKAENEFGNDAQSGAVVVTRVKVGISSPTSAPRDTTKPPQR